MVRHKKIQYNVIVKSHGSIIVASKFYRLVKTAHVFIRNPPPKKIKIDISINSLYSYFNNMLYNILISKNNLFTFLSVHPLSPHPRIFKKITNDTNYLQQFGGIYNKNNKCLKPTVGTTQKIWYIVRVKSCGLIIITS